MTAAVAICLAVGAAVGTHARTKDYASKLIMARTIVERWPSGRGRYLLGSELALAGRQEEAVSVLREAVRDYPPACQALGVELVAIARYEEATLALREFVRLNPGNTAVLPARQLLGQVLVERGDLSAAVTEFERILVDAPNNPTALRYLRALRGRVPG